MQIIKKLCKPVTLAIVILAVIAFAIFRNKLLAGCAGSPCNELRNMQWEGIFGPIIGVIGAYWIAKKTMIDDQRHRAEENNRPIIERIESVDRNIEDTLESFQHVKSAMLTIADELKTASDAKKHLQIDVFSALNTADNLAIENQLEQAEISLTEIEEIYSERLSFEDKKKVWVAARSIGYQRNLNQDFHRMLHYPYPASFTEFQWQAQIARNIELKCETFPNRLQRIKTDIKTISDRLRGRL